MGYRKHAAGKNRSRSAERGVGLLIAMSVMVVLLALSAMLMFLAGSESSSVGRQRYLTPLTYAAQAGLEEARSRMLRYHPQAFSNLTPPVQLPTALGQVVYIVNPAPGEAVNPLDLSPSNLYADNEYQIEFGVPITAATVRPFVASVQSTLASAPPIPFKWVRITLTSERSANADINQDLVFDNTIPIFFGGKQQNLNKQGSPVYQLTSLAAAPSGSTRILQVELAGIMGGFDYALAAGGQCQTNAAGSIYNITGNVLCNSSMNLVGPLTLNQGNLYSSGGISGTGKIDLTGPNQVIGSAVGVGVTGGSVSLTPITAFISPGSPTPAPLPANTLPNPDPAAMLPLVTQTNPAGTCVNGNLVFDLGNSVPPQIFQFNGSSYTSNCGTTFNPTKIPANVTFTGTGTLWFSGNPGNVSFYNNFGTSTQPVAINIIARPLSASTVGTTELEFRGQINNFAGLLYSQGSIESEGPVGGGSGSCPLPPPNAPTPGNNPNDYMFNVTGSLIAFGGGSSNGGGGGNKGGGGGGNSHAGIFDTEHCSDVSITYNPSLFTSNPPPGFSGLLSNGVVRTTVLNWHDVRY